MSSFIHDKTNSLSERALQRMENEGGIYSHEDLPQNVKVLLIDGAEAEASAIKEFLQKSTVPSFQVHYYTHTAQAMQFLQEQQVDIILLDFVAIGQHDAQGVFQKIHDISGEAPIIIFTGNTERDLALLIMKEGADNRITREQFAMSPESLRDAIEFSLVRSKALTSRLKQSEEEGAEELQVAQKKGAAALRVSEEKGAAELKRTQEESAVELEKMHKERLDDTRSHKQTLSWMSGGYSVEPTANGAESETKENAWQFIASELKRAQEEHAAQLKEAQRKEAGELKESEQNEALDLKRKHSEGAKPPRKPQDTRA